MRYLMALLLLIPFIRVNAQTSNDETIKLLCHKWRAVQMVAGPQKLDIPADGDYTLFKSDFTHEQHQGGTVRKSTWKYVGAQKKIVFASGDQFVIKEISASKLILTTTMEGMKVDMIFKHFE